MYRLDLETLGFDRLCQNPSRTLIISIYTSIESVPTRGDRNCNTSQSLMFGRYLKVRVFVHILELLFGSLYTILNHIIDIRMMLRSDEGSCMVCRPEWYQQKKKKTICYMTVYAT